MNINADPLLSQEDAAAFLGPPGKPVPLATMQWWRYRKRGPKYTKIGRHVYYRQSALAEYVQRAEVSTEEAADA